MIDYVRACVVLLALLLVSCRSATDVIDGRVLGCESGGDVMIRAGIEGFGTGGQELDDTLTIRIEVSNNARHEIFVKQIRVEQPNANTRGYRLDHLRMTVDRTIAEDDDFTFELPMSGRTVGGLSVQTLNDPIVNEVLEVVMSVYLGNGDVYRCPVRVPIPR